jgi:hypothetical protein
MLRLLQVSDSYVERWHYCMNVGVLDRQPTKGSTRGR